MLIYNPETGGWDTSPNQVVVFKDEQLVAEPLSGEIRECQGDMVRVTTTLGLVEDVFANHKYITMDSEGHRMRNHWKAAPTDVIVKEAGALTKDDRIGIAMQLPTPGKNIPGKDLVALAYAIQFRDSLKNEINLMFNYRDEQQYQAFKKAMRIQKINYVEVANRGFNRKLITLPPNALLPIAEKYSVEGGLPDAVWGMSNEQAITFIGELWNVGGKVRLRQINERLCPLAYYQGSEKLVDDLQKLMIRVGIPAFKNLRNDGWHIYISRHQRFLPFAERIKLRDHNAKNLKRSLALMKKRGWTKSETMFKGLFWDKVLSVEPIESQKATRYVGNYVGNGFVSHV